MSSSKPKFRSNDPASDEMYKNLSLTDFLRHFAPQEEAVREEAKRINESGTLPYLDPSVPPKPTSRTERRQRELKQRKADIKAKKINAKVEVLMQNPVALKKAIEDPKIKEAAMRLKHKIEEHGHV